MSTENQAISRVRASSGHSVSKPDKAGLSVPNAQSVHSQTAQPEESEGSGGVSRTDIRYWQNRIAKPIGRGGQESPHYGVQITHLGRRHRFKLRTSEKRAAAKSALAIYTKILVKGWDAALAENNPKAERRSRCCTIGEYLEELLKTNRFEKSTWTVYVQALRSIAADIKRIGDQPKLDDQGQPLKKRGKVVTVSRRDRYSGGVDAWRTKVDALPLSVFTDEAVDRWKKTYIDKHGGNPEQEQRAKHTVNSMLRSARSLFSKGQKRTEDRLKHVRKNLLLPEPLPFKGVALEEEGSMRYVSKVDAGQLIAAAKRDLAGDPARSEQFKIFCLGLLAGLRKREIDTLTWAQVNFDKGEIHIETTAFGKPKSKNSAAAVDCDPELLALLRGWKAKASGEFVVESRTKERYKNAPKGYYRCREHFMPFNDWLNVQGITDQKKLHTLRKELGSILANKVGIFAAMQVLRHAHIQTTSKHYADKRTFMTAGLGALLADAAEPAKVIAFTVPEPVQTTTKPAAKRTARTA